MLEYHMCHAWEYKVSLKSHNGKSASKSCIQGPELINHFSCSTQVSMKFIIFINVKMPTVAGILTFISMINTTSESLKAYYFL